MNASMYSLSTFEVQETECSCKFAVDDTIGEVKCYWQEDYLLQYISVTSSTFSVAHAIVTNGYQDLLQHRLSRAGYILFYCFTLISIMFGSTVGIYHIYMAALQETPWMFLLILALLLRIAPINIWARVLSKIFPIFQLSPKWFSFLPKHLPTTIMVCSLFWFLAFIRGFEGGANILKNLSRDVYGRSYDYPFQVMYPSFALRSSCMGLNTTFDCHRLRGWIDSTSASQVVERIYPSYLNKYEDLNGEERKDAVLNELEAINYFDNNVPELRLWYGNYRFLDPFYRSVSQFHLIDFTMLMVLAFSLTLVVESSIKAKMVPIIVLLAQVTPMMSQIVRFDKTDVISFISMLVVSAILITICIAIFYFFIRFRLYGRSSWYLAWIRLSLYFPFFFIPVQFLSFSYTSHLFFYGLFNQMVEFCTQSRSRHEMDTVYISEVSLENQAFLLAAQILSPAQITFVDRVLAMEKNLFKTNFWSILLEVYFAVLVVAVSLPLLAILSFETMAVARLGSASRHCLRFWLFAIFGISLAVYPLGLSAVHPRYSMFWSWWDLRVGSWLYETMKWMTGFQVTVFLREHVTLEWLDLDATNATTQEIMLSHLRGRMGPMIHSMDTMRSCGYGYFKPAFILFREIGQYTAEIRSQYMVLNKYLLYGHFNYGTLVLVALFIGAYFIVGDENGAG